MKHFRIQLLRQGAQQVDVDHYYPLYVRLVRRKKNLNREMLAQKAGIERRTLAWLENNWITPQELKREVKDQIEKALGISYQEFVRLNEPTLVKLAPHWIKRV